MLDKLLKGHPSLTHADDLIDICKPLERFMKINYFAHVNIDSKNNFTSLGKSPKFAEHYYRKGYYNVDVHLNDNQAKEEYVVQDTVLHHGSTDELFKDCAEFKINNIFTILQRKENSIDAFHFASGENNPKINEKYLSNLPFLKLFIQSFKEKVLSDRTLRKAYDYKIAINTSSDGYLSGTNQSKYNLNTQEFLDALDINRFYLPHDQNNTYLSKRELECLYWLHLGKTAEEIAMILSITERTVRAHTNKIRSKLNCYTLYQLGEKIAELDMLELLEQFR